MDKKNRTSEKSAEDRQYSEQAVPADAEAARKAADGSAEGGGSEELNQAVAEVMQALEASQQKAQEYFDGWARERADFSNYKRRIDREQAQSSQVIAANILKRYLPVVDDLERALKSRPNGGDLAAWSEGIELIYSKLKNILESEGLQRIPAETESFDPTRHEAISHEENPAHQSGDIIEVVQQGYTIGDRVLRPALVRVAR